jgi:hypothetical protein
MYAIVRELISLSIVTISLLSGRISHRPLSLLNDIMAEGD